MKDTIYYTEVDSPVGTLLLTSDGASLTGIYMEAHQNGPSPDGWVRDDTASPFAAARQQIAAYFDGRRTEFDLPLQPRGTDFQKRVWEELRKIPYGGTVSYGELAYRIGDPNAARAVGLANGRNPISIVVPCHRVIGSNGRLTGYAGGLSRKEALLAHESAVRTSGPQPFSRPSAPQPPSPPHRPSPSPGRSFLAGRGGA